MKAKRINGHKGYHIREDGVVVSTKHIEPRRLKSAPNTNGYPMVVLWNNGKAHSRTVHRIVADAFIPNPEKKRTINHINGDRTDNRVANLEWATHAENASHSFRELDRKPAWLGRSGDNHNKSKAVIQMSLDGHFIERFGSMREADLLGFDHSEISKCCLGKREKHKGFLWKYATDKEATHC